MLNEHTQSAGDLLRVWRQRRRLSQLALAVEADISQRHLSFVESGRSQPSRDMILHLAERLSIPLRDRNAILAAAGFAPIYRERSLDAPELASARAAVEQILHGHGHNPALAVDRNWTLVMANKAVGVLLKGVADHLLAGEVNVLRLSLHPDGLARRILNFREWRAHVLARLNHELDVSASPRLAALLEELKAYPIPPHAQSSRPAPAVGNGIAVPLTIASDEGSLSFISTTTVFGTAVDVTLSEVTIETFFPATPDTASAMQKLLDAS